MRFHGMDIAGEIKNRIVQECKDPLGLRFVDIGPVEMLPEPDLLSNMVPAVVIEPQEITIEYEESGDLAPSTLPFLIYYIYNAQEGEHPATVAGGHVETIAKVLQEFEKVGDPTLESMRIMHSEVTGINYAPDWNRDFWLLRLFFAGMEISYRVTGQVILD